MDVPGFDGDWISWIPRFIPRSSEGSPTGRASSGGRRAGRPCGRVSGINRAWSSSTPPIGEPCIRSDTSILSRAATALLSADGGEDPAPDPDGAPQVGSGLCLPRLPWADRPAGADLLPDVVRLRVCPASACRACPGFMKTRYSSSTVATRTWGLHTFLHGGFFQSFRTWFDRLERPNRRGRDGRTATQASTGSRTTSDCLS